VNGLVLTVVTDSESTPAARQVASAANATGEAVTVGGSLIDEIVREGARRMLAAALEAEVAAYIAALSPSRWNWTETARTPIGRRRTW
jgi:hypothetical protein